MEASELEIRPLRGVAELAACVELQKDTWGRDFTDVVPGSLLNVTQRIGGVAAGAFDASDQLVGFVFGITGVEQGRIVHWSDMLAVRPELRNSGIGRRLKEYQRREVRALGATVIYWTYDPLVARNAHLNFNVFGVRALEYVVDMYGETDSVLHRGIGTDRFVVAWPTSDEEMRTQLAENQALAADAARRSAPVLNPRPNAIPRNDATAVAKGSSFARVAIPYDVHELRETDAARARWWRESTRSAVGQALREGWSVDGFVVDARAHEGYYLLSRRR
jgi:chorismate synthase